MRRNQSGFSLMEVIASSVIMSMALAAMITMISTNAKSRMQLEVAQGILAARKIVGQTALSPTTWEITKNDPANSANMNCLINKAALCPMPAPALGYPVRLALSANQALYDPAVPTMGIRYDGTPCTGFSEANYNPNCPLRYEISWKPLCSPPNVACANPMVEVYGRLVVPDYIENMLSINVRNYELRVFLGSEGLTLENACRSIGGVFDPTTYRCSSPIRNLSCPANQAVTSVSFASGLTCGPIATGTCLADGGVPSVQMIVSGIDFTGSVQCQPQVCDCVPNINWPAACDGCCGTGTRTGALTSTRPAINGGAACAPPPYIEICDTGLSCQSVGPSCNTIGCGGAPGCVCTPDPSNWDCNCPPCVTTGTPIFRGPTIVAYYCDRSLSYAAGFSHESPLPVTAVYPDRTCPVACPAGTYQPLAFAGGIRVPYQSRPCISCGTIVNGFSPAAGSAACTIAGNGMYVDSLGPPPQFTAELPCTNAPANAFYTGPGNGSNNCPWNCDEGYTEDDGGTAANHTDGACLPIACGVNQYLAGVDSPNDFSTPATCTGCPPGETQAAGSFTSCGACGALTAPEVPVTLPGNANWNGVGAGCTWACISGQYNSGTGNCDAGGTGGGGGGVGGGCFIAGTQIKMSNGQEKPIEEVQVGDLVLHFREDLQKVEVDNVSKRLDHPSQEQTLYSFRLSNGRILTANAIHLIYVATFDRYIDAARIYSYWLSGIPIVFKNSKEQEVELTGMQKWSATVPVYNLHIEDEKEISAYYLNATDVGHNYYAEDVLVHNAKCINCELN